MKKGIFCFFLTLYGFCLFGEWDSFETFPPMGIVYHPVTTPSKEAQEFFDRGLLALFAFNHDEAFVSFQRAVELDPGLAMGYWGMAYSIGENINMPITEENNKKAYALVQKALNLSSKSTINEQAYIYALSKRYSDNPNSKPQRLSQAYSEAMRKLVNTFPDDLDAASLFAESLMDLRPWKLWSPDGKPAKGTLEILGILESVLQRNPMHLGANHFYIHAMEASKHPERALISAYRLDNLLPEWGHILHMPSHIYILVGDYEKAVKANQAAIRSDEVYIQKHGLSGIYPLHYMSHNFFFLCRAQMWLEQFNQAYQTAKKLEQFISPHIDMMPKLAYYTLAPMQVLLYFHRWKELLDLKPSKYEVASVGAYRHFARAMAYASLGKLPEAKIERQMFLEGMKEIERNEMMLGYNSAEQVLKVAELLLDATIAKANGNQEASIKLLKQAVDGQDQLFYNEPPDWYYPIRQTLGAAYLETNQPQLAEEVFREALNRLPRNGRSLFGLLQSLKAQGKRDSLYFIERETKAALQHAEGTLRIESL